MNREDLELYVMGMYDGDIATLERELADDAGARAVVAEEAQLELLLRDAAAAATFCPACDDLVSSARCHACGAAIRPGGYTVERVLVSNAHGRMYAARDVDGKQVALKELVFVQSPTVEALAAFEREARFLRALEHPAIPRFCASFQEEAGVHTRYYLAQELVTGEALDRRLEDHFFSEAEILGIARQVLDVLVYLQGLSPMVIHRDIKPANLVVQPDGTIAVVDFGAAHVQGMTVGSTAIGTFGYMPLEQLAGEVDATTDVYALGASLLHLLTRREPWRLLQSGLLADVQPNVGRRTRALLARMVAPNPRDRFRSAAEALAALDRLEHRKPSARMSRPALAPLAAASSLVVAAKARSRLPRRILLAVGAVAVVTAGVNGIAALTEPNRSTQRDAARDAARDAKRAWKMADEARRAQDEMRRAQELMRRLDDEVQQHPHSHIQLRGPLVASAGKPLIDGERRDGEGGDAVDALEALTTQLCACSDQACADAVSVRINAWGRDMATRVPWGKRSAMKHMAELSQRNLVCLTRIAPGLPGEAAEAPNVEVWTSQPPGYQPGTPAQRPAP
jgi:protein kinase-like protein